MEPFAFHLGSLPIRGRLVLAPMDGFSDRPFRTLCRRFGSAISYTAFVGPDDVLAETSHAARWLDYDEAERPVVFQLFDDDEDRLLAAARHLMSLRPDAIDVNMGCSARCVAGRGAGAGLLRDPRKVGRVVARLTAALPVPVTAKIRLGWDADTRNFLVVARAVEENGGRLLAIHGRTKAQGYTGEADWEPIAEVKASVGIPVIGNGDVESADQAMLRLRQTGCDAVMIGRAAIGNPWIFRGPGHAPPTWGQVAAVIRSHLREMIATYGGELGPRLFRKHLARYLDHLDPLPEERRALLTCPTGDRVNAFLDRPPTRPPQAAHRLPRTAVPVGP